MSATVVICDRAGKGALSQSAVNGRRGVECHVRRKVGTIQTILADESSAKPTGIVLCGGCKAEVRSGDPERLGVLLEVLLVGARGLLALAEDVA